MRIFGYGRSNISFVLDGGNDFTWYDIATDTRMIITSAGDVGIGSTGPSQKLHVNWTALATAWNVSSDIRKKENVKLLEKSLDKLSKIRWVSFNWKEWGKQDVWIIAQEVGNVYPEFVTTDTEGYKSVDYGKLVSPIIEAVKELKIQNEELKERILILENR